MSFCTEIFTTRPQPFAIRSVKNHHKGKGWPLWSCRLMMVGWRLLTSLAAKLSTPMAMKTCPCSFPLLWKMRKTMCSACSVEGGHAKKKQKITISRFCNNSRFCFLKLPLCRWQEQCCQCKLDCLQAFRVDSSAAGQEEHFRNKVKSLSTVDRSKFFNLVKQMAVKAEGSIGKIGKYNFLGHSVCFNAFQLLTGASRNFLRRLSSSAVWCAWSTGRWQKHPATPQSSSWTICRQLLCLLAPICRRALGWRGIAVRTRRSWWWDWGL